MPKFTEKKFRVSDFDEIKERLKKLGAVPQTISSSDHFYAKLETPGVVKLVTSSKKSEIHILDEAYGTFSLKKRIAVEGKDAGIEWLQERGYADLSHIKMSHEDYLYDGGIVGLYVINDSIHSLILDYPVSRHDSIAHVFDLDEAEVIDQPYNRYLSNLDKD